MIVFVTEFTVVRIVVKFRDSKGSNGSKREPWKYVRILAWKWIRRLETGVRSCTRYL